MEFSLCHLPPYRAAGDVSLRKDVDRVLDGVDCVFHLASYGMSGKEMLQPGRTDAVNINGTCNVLEGCHEFGVNRLVYVSTYNVVFGGQEIVNGNEALPYFPIDDHVDPYGRSKSVAEQLVLRSNGRPSKYAYSVCIFIKNFAEFESCGTSVELRFMQNRFQWSRKKNGACLYTCAVRPAAIYGPGEERHLPRILGLAKKGLMFFKVGQPNVKTDWIYVDNLVLALILASMGILDHIPGRKGQPVAAGKPYFVSDGNFHSSNKRISFNFRSLLAERIERTSQSSVRTEPSLFLSNLVAAELAITEDNFIMISLSDRQRSRVTRQWPPITHKLRTTFSDMSAVCSSENALFLQQIYSSVLFYCRLSDQYL